MFEISKTPFGPYQLFEIRNKHNGAYFNGVLDCGGCMNELVIPKNNQFHSLLMNSKDADFFQSKAIRYYSGMCLFPFPNRVNNATYVYQGKTYQLPKNDDNKQHSLHGLVYNQVFEYLAKDEEKGIVQLVYQNHGQHSGYPFSFELKIKYQLLPNGIAISTSVINPNHYSIPIGVGWHPYIKTGSKVDELYLKIPGEEFYITDDHLIPTLELSRDATFLNLSKIGNRVLNDCYKIESVGRAETIIFDQAKNISVKVWQDGNAYQYNFVQYYIPPERDAIAIEPMTCIPNAFNNGIGLNYLEPQSEVHLSFGIEIS